MCHETDHIQQNTPLKMQDWNYSQRCWWRSGFLGCDTLTLD